MKQKNQLVNLVVSMTSLEIVLVINKLRQEEGNTTELLHKNFIVKIESEFEEEIRELNFKPSQYKQKMPTGGEKLVKQYVLNKTQTLQMLMSESKTVRKAVITYIEHLELQLKEKQEQELIRVKARQDARIEYRPMTDAILAIRGADTKPYHYSNEANLVYLVVMGATCKKLKEHLELDNLDNLRDALTPLQIAAVQDIQKHNTTLLEIEMGYDERKIKLNKLFYRKWAVKLLEEHIRLEA